MELLTESKYGQIEINPDLFYAVFNTFSFYLWNRDELHCLFGGSNIDMSLPEMLSGISDKGTHFVAEFSSMDELFDFYISKSWRDCVV
jgi:hypothetical protein